MSYASLTDDLVRTVRLMAYLPDTSDLTDANILDLANRALAKKFLPAIKNLRNDYFEYTQEFTTLDNGNGYLIPPRAVGNTISALYMVLPNFGIYPITYVDEGDIDGRLENAAYVGNQYYTNYFIRNHKFYLSPRVVGQKTLRLVYSCRSGDLILSTDARQVTGVTSTTITLSSALPTVTTGAYFDVVSKDSPYAYNGMDLLATNVTTNVITVAAVPADVAIGDWVAPQYKTPIPQVPYDFHGALIDEVVASVLSAVGDKDAYDRAKAEAKESLDAALASLAPRVDKENTTYVADTGTYGRFGGYFRRGF